MARVKKGTKVTIESTKRFEDQQAAREYILKVVEAGTLFIHVEEWYEDVKDPEPVKPEPPKPEPKPEKKKPEPKPGTKKEVHTGGKAKKFTPAVDRYIKDHRDMSNEDLVKALKRSFDVDTTESSVANRKWVLGVKSSTKPVPKSEEKEKEDTDQDIDDLDLD